MKKEFTSYEVGSALQIPKERLRGWMKENFIIPTTEAKGRGTKSFFTLVDVYGVALFKDLLEWGFTRKHASFYVNDLIRHGAPELINYIVFRFESDPNFGETCQDAYIPAGDHLHEFNIKLGIPTSELFIDPVDPTNEWNRIILINYKMIRERVDRALLTL